MNKELIIKVRGLSKRYHIGKSYEGQGGLGFLDLVKLPYNMLRGSFFDSRDQEDRYIWALKDVSFDVFRGERIGIIGRNGAGKTTLLKILSRLAYPTEGKAYIKGRATALFGVGTGFKPNLTGRQNIYLDASLHGLTKSEIKGKFDDIVEFSGLHRFIDTPVKYYSKGMYTRLAFAVTAHLDPDILLLDEILAGGDMGFKKKCLGKVEGLAAGGRTIILVSHSMSNILKFCDKVMWLEEGGVQFLGNVVEGVELYQTFMTPTKDNEVNLEHRTDFLGSGAVQITKIGLYNGDLQPIKAAIAGQDVIVGLDYRCDFHRLAGNEKELTCSLYVEDEKAQKLFGLPSSILKSSQPFPLENTGTLLCRIKRLPLLPGHYNLSYTLAVGKDNAHKLLQARSLVVLDGDFYGSGRIQHENMGPFCVDYQWDHQEQNE